MSNSILIRQATKTYRTWGRTVHALRSIDLAVPESKITLIVGSNGSGKSTLLRAIAGALSLDSGNILIGEKPLMSIRRGEIARRRGVLQQVPQSNLCLSFTVGEMAKLYLDGWTTEDVKSALSTIVGYGIRSNSRVRELSGGQQQLVALELVLARRPSILLLDEPTASLDPTNSSRIVERVGVAAGLGVTVVLVTHQLELGLRVSDNVHLMHDGRIVGSWSGSAKQELSSNVIKKLLAEAAATDIARPEQ